MPKTEHRRVLSRQETADQLGCSVQTVAKMIARGELRTVKVGDIRKVTKASVDALFPTDDAAT